MNLGNLNIVLQFLIITGWFIIFIYVFLKKRGYLNRVQQIIISCTSIGYMLLGLYFLENQPISLPVIWIFRDFVIIGHLILIFILLHKREVQIENIVVLNEYKKIYDFIPVPVCANRVEDGVMIYANKCFKENYNSHEGISNTEFWGRRGIEYDNNNRKACVAKDNYINVVEKVKGVEKEFIKYCICIAGVEYVFTIQKTCNET